MASKKTHKKQTRKIPSFNAIHLFVGTVVVLSLATLVMVISQPGAIRRASQGTQNKLYLSAQNQDLTKDSIVEVQMLADSGAAKVNAVQAKLEYPADKLQFFGIRQSSAFPVEAATNTANPGVILVGRGTELGSEGISGRNEVVTLSFKVLADTADAAMLKFDPEFSMLVQSSDNTDILAGTSGTYLEAN